MNKILTYVVQLILVSVLVFGLHYIFQQVLGVLGNWENTGYSLHLIYLFELMMSIIMIVAVVASGKSMPNNIGYVFLALLTLKCLGNYFFIQPVLGAEVSNDFVKHNFLIIFIIFLVFDVYVTYRVLNQENVKTPE